MGLRGCFPGRVGGNCAAMEPAENLSIHDPELASALADEVARQQECLTLIASENHCSAAVRACLSSPLTDKYAEGYPGARYYGGCQVADRVEALARERATALFGAEHANVQPHSGTQANLAVYMALMEPGDTLLGMDLAAGGHLSHGSRMSHTGTIFQGVHYGVHPETGQPDYDEVEALAERCKPRVLVAGGSALPREVDWERLGGIARRVGAWLLADIAHTAGLVAGGVHKSPFPHADVVTMTTHKTLRGPRGGMVLCKAELARRIDKSVFPGGQGGPLLHVIAAKACAFGEALKPEFKAYAARVVENAVRLGEGLKEFGFDLVSGGTDTHLLLLDLRKQGITGQQAETALLRVGIVANKNLIPNDPRKAREASGLRLGTAAVTTRGMGPAEMERLARIIHRALTGTGEEETLKAQVLELARAFPVPGMSGS